MRILTYRDMQRLESTVRKIERIIEIDSSRKHPVFMGTGLGGGIAFPIPDGRKTIEPIPYQSDPVNIYLTRDDRNKMVFWDGPSAALAPNFDGADRIFWLPEDAQVGDTFWLCFMPLVYCSVRPVSLDQSIIASFYDYSGGTTEYPYQKYIHSYRFDPDDKRYERADLTYVNLTGTPRALTTVVVVYTGESISRPISYTDMNGDTYYNLLPEDDEPLIWGNATGWSVIYEGNGQRAFLALDPWWYSYDPWPVLRHS